MQTRIISVILFNQNIDARRYKKDKERLSFELLEIQQQRERKLT